MYTHYFMFPMHLLKSVGPHHHFHFYQRQKGGTERLTNLSTTVTQVVSVEARIWTYLVKLQSSHPLLLHYIWISVRQWDKQMKYKTVQEDGICEQLKHLYSTSTFSRQVRNPRILFEISLKCWQIIKTKKQKQNKQK